MRYRLSTLLMVITLASALLAGILGLWKFAEGIDAILNG
jgi:hypothetical protein